MKAIRVSQFGGPEVLKWEEVPDLKAGPAQVVISVKAAGVNPFETYIRAGSYASMPTLPYTPGVDGAGVVLSIGTGVTKLKTGDRVYFIGALSGSYAEQALASESNIYPLAEKITFSQGAAMGVPYGTAYRALFHRAQAQKGETVLIHGASGGVGTAAVQLAKRAGLMVIGTGGSDKGRQMVKTEGADVVLDHHDDQFAAKLLEATQGKGVDVIIEMLANVNLGKDLSFLAKRGRVVVVGSRGPVEINPRDIMGRDAAILGMTLFNTPPQDLAQMHSDMAKGLADGSIKPIIGQEFPFKDASQAHAAIGTPGAQGKIVLIP